MAGKKPESKMENQKLLLDELIQYGKTDRYPFHMPGHKRQEKMGITCFPNPFSVDISEIEGFDNLHKPEGLLKKSMEHAAGVYHADKTWYLVNGSTCGILSAICGTVKRGGRFLMARNSHKSAYHAVLLRDLAPEYIFPEYVEQYVIQGKITPESVDTLLKAHSDIEAVYITSPTYEGIVSDVKAIADIVHQYGIPLIVDEAHGAHFSFGGKGKNFPKSALDCGADVVIQSLHKTLPSLTQTALLHIKGKLVSSERIEQYLTVFESSSPSYVLLASIENCIHFMEGEGTALLAEHGRRMKEWEASCAGLKYIKLMTENQDQEGRIKGRDLSKILIYTKEAEITGIELANILRERYHLEAEMCCQSYVLFMTSLMDQAEGLTRLKKALFEIDKCLCTDDNKSGSGKETEHFTWVREPEECMRLSAASEAPQILIGLREVPGHISGNFITVYPPGIPMLVPGERITEETVKLIEYHMAQGLTVEGVTGKGKVRVTAEE